MRYFITGFVAIVCLVIAVAGFRGSITRNRPIEIFPDMDRQARVRPQAPNLFNEIYGANDGRGSRLPVKGVIARGVPITDEAVNTGKKEGTDEWIEVNPLKVTKDTLERGRERYDIYCTPCHGKAGDGNGITSQYNLVAADLHQMKLVQIEDGYIFDVLKNGYNLTTNEVGIVSYRMPAYDSKMSNEDLWHVVSYLRALQYSQLGKLEEIEIGRDELQKVIEAK
jgi:mono/diheme cytochrome c family protein|tara:strand:- start:115 stop:786 length:672 start_codon:yes stop_codon:yes gene_type:complete